MKGHTLSCVCRRFLRERSKSSSVSELLPRSSLRNASTYDYGICNKFSTSRDSNGQRKLNYETRVLSFGDGSNGALGHDAEGYLSDVFEPVPVQGLPKNIVKVAAGHYHSLAVTDEGEVWAWGRNAEGQLGRPEGNSREDWRRPRRVEGLGNVEVKDVAGSGVVSVAIGHDGSLWSWGSSKRGQLGLAPSVIRSLLPRRIEALSDHQVSQVALGWGHVLACTAEGELFAWGYGEDGRLGFSVLEVANEFRLDAVTTSQTLLKRAGVRDTDSQKVFEKEGTAVSIWRPYRVQALAHERVIKVASGMDHSLALSENGNVYSFGDDSLGQLGRPVNPEGPVGTVAFLDGPMQAIAVAAGLGHSLAITSKTAEGIAVADSLQSSNLYSWGWNSASQLGRSGEADRPGLVEGLDDETTIDAKGGRAHSVGLTLDNTVCVWGSGKNGRLGLGSSADEPYPFPIESMGSVSTLQVACGFDHSLMLVRERS